MVRTSSIISLKSLSTKLLSRKIIKQRLFYYFIIISIILFIVYTTNFLYYSAYTFDYLLNRGTYTFQEEGEFNNNTFLHTNSFLQQYMENSRNNQLKNLSNIRETPLPEISIDELTPELVAKVSDNFSKPFVIRGLIKDFDCVKKWNIDYFEKEYGNIEMLSFSDSKSVSYSNTQSTKLKNCNKDSNLCSMKEITKGIRYGEPVYVNNISALFTESEQARKELNLDKMSHIMNSKMLKYPQKDNHFLSQLFFGGKNTGTNLHCASNINFFFNIYGIKHWSFIDPKYTHLIKCQTSDKGLFSISEDDYFSKDPNNPFFKIPRFETILQPGDFLFNPAWYWHAVKNKTDYTIAVANRYSRFQIMGELPIIQNNYFFSFLQLFSPTYYLKWFSEGYKTNVDVQKAFGKMVDGEIINNMSRSRAM